MLFPFFHCTVPRPDLDGRLIVHRVGQRLPSLVLCYAQYLIFVLSSMLKSRIHLQEGKEETCGIMAEPFPAKTSPPSNVPDPKHPAFALAHMDFFLDFFLDFFFGVI